MSTGPSFCRTARLSAPGIRAENNSPGFLVELNGTDVVPILFKSPAVAVVVGKVAVVVVL